ncbi:hypothetical protein HanIR_Chr15g0750821 [Helianthus annuus]|nr:hypothetical protein HanIR_Chr15g0750821 [Helianthus annuus]
MTLIIKKQYRFYSHRCCLDNISNIKKKRKLLKVKIKEIHLRLKVNIVIICCNIEMIKIWEKNYIYYYKNRITINEKRNYM